VDGVDRLIDICVKVEHIIREDYLVEAMEILEMYCDLLLARFGLIETMKTCDEGLLEAVCTLIWITPRLSTDIAELKQISEQLALKYGRPFAEQARANKTNSVNERIVERMSVQAPPRSLVENYLVEIGKSHNVPYTADPSAFLVRNHFKIESVHRMYVCIICMCIYVCCHYACMRVKYSHQTQHAIHTYCYGTLKCHVLFQRKLLKQLQYSSIVRMSFATG
jgi:hypothetical protein